MQDRRKKERKKALTVVDGIVAGMPDNSHGVGIEVGEVADVLFTSRFREWEDTLVAVVEVCKERDGT